MVSFFLLHLFFPILFFIWHFELYINSFYSYKLCHVFLWKIIKWMLLSVWWSLPPSLDLYLVLCVLSFVYGFIIAPKTRIASTIWKYIINCIITTKDLKKFCENILSLIWKKGQRKLCPNNPLYFITTTGYHSFRTLQ